MILPNKKPASPCVVQGEAMEGKKMFGNPDAIGFSCRTIEDVQQASRVFSNLEIVEHWEIDESIVLNRVQGGESTVAKYYTVIGETDILANPFTLMYEIQCCYEGYDLHTEIFKNKAQNSTFLSHYAWNRNIDEALEQFQPHSIVQKTSTQTHSFEGMKHHDYVIIPYQDTAGFDLKIVR